MGFFSRLIRDRLAVAGLAIVLGFFVMSLLTPVVAPYDPAAIDVDNILAPPSARHLFGTDDLGRDVFTRMLYGAGISLKVGFVAVGIAVVIGTLLGAVSGYYGGIVDIVIMRFVDIMLCFPSFFLILAVIAFMEPSIFNIMAVIGFTSWMGITRLVRAEFLSLKERDFVLAVKAMGAGAPRIIFGHILPNAMAPVLVAATLGIASAVLTESALSFLGIGVQPPTPSWGNMLTQGQSVLGIAWWLSFFPGMAILVTVLGYNLLGEGIRDAIDPRLRQ
ncbi:MAG TPA: ABC transporter permease [Deltaproteobacteria bacterium]|nr:MAG: Oligopeptide transport system permease protein OppC [Deltaproteobacteria bacterium ADurb.Bin072]HNQ86636.1 ABC transporter permease [Deltaproteobacteria bacterium]HRW80914.1 ABC transporter permease [Desulfomonilia bacterium]HNS90754.1 ABC transporter permease [Deltaproteobacteria bacterium]HOA45571.1 ABC transporter permease [Deltaproteobacteria bacterium]